MTAPIISWEIVARQGETGEDVNEGGERLYEDGLAKIYLHRSYGGYTVTDIHHIAEQLRELVRRMRPYGGPTP